MKNFTITLILWLFCFNAHSQDLQWVHTLGNASNWSAGKLVITDFSGTNILCTGVFNDTIDLDPGVGVEMATADGFDNPYIQKFDPSGNLIWAFGLIGASSQSIIDIATDNLDNIYIIGQFGGTLDLDPSADTSFITGNGSFLAKYDNSGNFVWAKSIDGMVANGIALNDSGSDILIVGSFGGGVDFDPGAVVSYQFSAGSFDGFILRLDGNGDFIYAHRYGSINDDYFNSVDLSPTSQVTITGGFSGTVDFDSDADVLNLTSNGYLDVFVMTFNIDTPDDPAAWSMGGINQDNGLSVVNGADNNIYLTGVYSETGIDFDPGVDSTLLNSMGLFDVFIAGYTPTGTLIFAKSIGGISADNGSKIAETSSGSFYVGGHFSFSADLDPGTGTASYIASGGQDAFIVNLNSSGDYIWGAPIEGLSTGTCSSIALTSSDELIATGNFRGSTDFDPSASSNMVAPLGTSDAFLLKWDTTTATFRIPSITNFGVSIYPNPTNGTFTVSTPNSFNQTTLEIHDLLGRLISRHTATGVSSIQLELNEKPGIYLLSIIQGDQKQTVKILKN